MQRSAAALIDMLDAIDGGEEERARPRRSSRRCWRSSARRSGGWTSSPPRTRWDSTRPQETARILAESIDYARQGQLAAKMLAMPAVPAHK